MNALSGTTCNYAQIAEVGYFSIYSEQVLKQTGYTIGTHAFYFAIRHTIIMNGCQVFSALYFLH